MPRPLRPWHLLAALGLIGVVVVSSSGCRSTPFAEEQPTLSVPDNGVPPACKPGDGIGDRCSTCAVGQLCCKKSGCFDANDCKYTGDAPASGCWDAASSTCDMSQVCQRAQPATGPHVVTLKNRTGQTVWIAALSSAGAVDPAGWNWEIANGAEHSLTLPHGWDSGRFWARTGCVDLGGDGLACEVGDCEKKRTCTLSGLPPLSVAEFTFDGGRNPGQPDNYDVSFVDGWNFQIEVQPKTPPGQCKTVGTCSSTPACWQAGKWPTSGPPYKGCISPCGIKQDARHCCKCDLSANSNCTCGEPCCDHAGSFGCSPFYPDGATPAQKTNLCMPHGTETRPGGEVLSRPESKWDPEALAYITNVAGACADVYAWQFHDLSSLAKCSDDPNPVDYDVTFRPSPVN